VTETERIVRTFHESWDLRDPERGAKLIAQDCQFEDGHVANFKSVPMATPATTRGGVQRFPTGKSRSST